MAIKVVKIEKEENLNAILGQSHFIKTVEDMHEALITSCPGIKFGFAFNEASGPCLVRYSGNDDELVKLAIKNAKNVGAGHFFIIFIKNAYPINVINKIKMIPEVVRIFAASANPMEVVVYETEQGRAVLGVVDGFSIKGEETDKDIKERKELLRKFGYKL